MQTERWEELEILSHYEISDQGQVYSQKRDTLLKPWVTKKGYHVVRLFDFDGYRHFFVHRLVAAYFVPGDRSLQVDHVDGVKSHNNYENLEWVTGSENILRAYRTGLKHAVNGYGTRRVVIHETGEIFESASACARAIQGSFSNVAACLRGERTHHLGYHFSFAE